MKRMTPREFYDHSINSDNIENVPGVFDLMQAYADHCEETAWTKVEDGLPLPDESVKHATSKSADYNILDADGLVFESYYDHYRRAWFSFGNVGLFIVSNVVAWRPLPKPPTQ